MEIEKANIWVDAIDESHVNMAEFYYFENAFTRRIHEGTT
jgi:hypothetical protein